MKCSKCGGAKFRESSDVMERKFDGRTYRGSLVAEECASCGNKTFDLKEVGRFDREIAETMARAGEPTGGSFQWMRKTLALRAAELAPMLDVSAETISRWETGDREVPKLAWVALSRMVLEGKGKRGAMFSRLASLLEPSKLAKVVDIDKPSDEVAAARRSS